MSFVSGGGDAYETILLHDGRYRLINRESNRLMQKGGTEWTKGSRIVQVYHIEDQFSRSGGEGVRGTGHPKTFRHSLTDDPSVDEVQSFSKGSVL